VPGKSRHSNKKSFYSKKDKNTLLSSSMATQQQVQNQTSAMTTSQKEIASSKGVTASTLPRNPYVVTELAVIGILTGIILVILVVLYLILS